MIRSIKAITVAIAATSALTIAMPAAAMASTAKPATMLRPLTGSGCFDKDSGVSIVAVECTKVVGTGLKVTSIAGQYNNGTNSAQTIYIDFYGPKGYITKTANLKVAGQGSTSYYTWHNPNPNANMPAGYYCTEAFFSNGTAIISDCIEVHT